MERDASWIVVTDRTSADELLSLARSFHDGVVTRAVWVGAESLNASRELELQGPGALLLAVDSQFADVPCIELHFQSVQQYRYDYDADAAGDIKLGSGGVTAKFLAWEIFADFVKYRIVRST